VRRRPVDALTQWPVIRRARTAGAWLNDGPQLPSPIDYCRRQENLDAIPCDGAQLDTQVGDFAQAVGPRPYTTRGCG